MSPVLLKHGQLSGHHVALGCRRKAVSSRATGKAGLERISTTCPHKFFARQEQRVPRSVDCDSEECTTSPSSYTYTDLGTRITLERLYHLSDGLQHLWGSYIPGLDVWTGPGLFFISLDEQPSKTKGTEKSPDYYANVGDAIRTLREDIPSLFAKDLNYEIYREDISFKDPRNAFQGLKNYQTIFWSLRFHGRIFFKSLYVEVKRVWQPEDHIIKMRWTVHGIPRVPWEAEGTFDGISTYKLDKNGKIYEHSVDNVLLRDPPMQRTSPLLAGLNLIPSVEQQPCPGAWFRDAGRTSQELYNSSELIARFSWVRMYVALCATVQLRDTQQKFSLQS